MRTRKKTGNATIRAAMRQNEQYVLGEIERNGTFALSGTLCTLGIYNAIQRLAKRGKIRFDQKRRSYVLCK